MVENPMPMFPAGHPFAPKEQPKKEPIIPVDPLTRGDIPYRDAVEYIYSRACGCEADEAIAKRLAKTHKIDPTPTRQFCEDTRKTIGREWMEKRKNMIKKWRLRLSLIEEEYRGI